MYYLGLDTSCYTTSVALVDEEEKLFLDKRIMLKVKEGTRGIRQSDAFYQHIGNLDILLREVFDNVKDEEIKAIGVSSKPRNNESSYMPVFNGGLHISRIMSMCLNIPLFLLSHQENHIMAGLWSQEELPHKNFTVYHLSGGTSELLYVERENGMRIKVIGGTSDLKAGQFIDRVGVSMGLSFPCGKEMDMLSKLESDFSISISSSVKGSYTSFSGPETYAQRVIKEGNYNKGGLSKAIFLCIAKSIEETLINSKSDGAWGETLFVGGVSSNSIIKEYLLKSSKLKEYNIKPIFSHSRYSVDNALGAALYARKAMREKRED